MYQEITAAIASFRLLGDIIQASKNLRDSSELATAVSEVNAKLLHVGSIALDGQQKHAADAERIRELEKQIREFEDWRSQMERYALFQFPTGTFAYSIKSGMEEGQPLHYLCATCVDNNQKSMLQPLGHGLYCPRCKTNIAIQDTPAHKVDSRIMKGIRG